MSLSYKTAERHTEAPTTVMKIGRLKNPVPVP